MSAIETTITVDIPSVGTFRTNALGLELAIMRHLPANVHTLQQTITERSDIDCSDIDTVAACLVVLASLDN